MVRRHENGAPNPVAMTARELEARVLSWFGDADLVVQVSRQLEQAMPWRGRVPALVAEVS